MVFPKNKCEIKKNENLRVEDARSGFQAWKYCFEYDGRGRIV
jgi:hypothetical protein